MYCQEIEPAIKRDTLVVICASCHRILNDDGEWVSTIEQFENDSTYKFSHGLCPRCARELYPEWF